MRHDHDRVFLFEAVHEVLNREGGDRVEGRARFVHEEHLGLDRDGAGDAQALLLAAGKRGTRLIEAVLHFLPEVGAAQRALHDFLRVGLLDLLRIEPHPRQHIVANRHGGEGIGTLEDHAHVLADGHRVHPGAVNIIAVDKDVAGHVGAVDHFMHTVEGTQERGFAAPGRADQRGHRIRFDIHIDVLHGEEITVVNVLVTNTNSLRHCFSFRLPR